MQIGLQGSGNWEELMLVTTASQNWRRNMLHCHRDTAWEILITDGESYCTTYWIAVAYLRNSTSKNNLSSHLGWGGRDSHQLKGDWGGKWELHIKNDEGGKNNKHVQQHTRFFPRNLSTTFLWIWAHGSVTAPEQWNVREEEGLLGAWKTQWTHGWGASQKCNKEWSLPF